MNLAEARTLADLKRRMDAQEAVVEVLNAEVNDLQARLIELESRPKRGRPRKANAPSQ